MGEKQFLSITRGKATVSQKYQISLAAVSTTFTLSLLLDMKPNVSNFLISCLVGIYIFQFYNGYRLLVLYFSTSVDCPHWQVSGCMVALS